MTYFSGFLPPSLAALSVSFMSFPSCAHHSYEAAGLGSLIFLFWVYRHTTDAHYSVSTVWGDGSQIYRMLVTSRNKIGVLCGLLTLHYNIRSNNIFPDFMSTLHILIWDFMFMEPNRNLSSRCSKLMISWTFVLFGKLFFLCCLSDKNTVLPKYPVLKPDRCLCSLSFIWNFWSINKSCYIEFILWVSSMSVKLCCLCSSSG